MGYEEAFEIAHKYHLDIVCLQECYRELLPAKEGDFSLASKTMHGFLGLAIYYRTMRFDVVSSARSTIHPSLYERISSQENERIVAVKLYDKLQKKELFIASFHAIHLVASNRLRRIQVREAILFVNKHNPPLREIATIVVGDYNYPWFQNRLKKAVAAHDYTLFVSKKPTLKNGWFSGKFDLVSARHVSKIDMLVLPRGKSDHMPVRINLAY
jgi:endonuclease/exonuclease/phosphatase family metal-dependent hydrolase